MEEVKVDSVLDARGLKCPMPVVKARKAIDALAPGQVLKIEVTDPGSMADFKAWTRATGHALLVAEEAGGIYTYVVRHK